MGLFQKLAKWKNSLIQREDPIYEVEDWNEIVYDRDDLQIHDKKQRDEYVRGCLEQIAEASRELENLQHEYNMVTSYLKDMEEIEALPEEEKTLLQTYARQINELETVQSGYLKKESRMSETKFRQLERMEDEIQEGCEKLSKAEEYQELIKRDLRRLDGEKHAYLFRRNELKHMIEDSRSMAIVCTTAVVICILILFVLQFGLNMNARMGYFAAAALGAVAITAIFIKHNSAVQELKQVESGISRIIRLRNTVKIRYVNNTHLLDYLYLKYSVSSAKELLNSWQQYQREKEEREHYYKTEKALDECQKNLLHELRRYQVQDPVIWLHQTAALLDKKEMVEIRHNLIERRQKLRVQMEYNKRLAEEAQQEIKKTIEDYPQYREEILSMVNRFQSRIA